MIRRLFAPALALALVGCAHGPSAPEKPFVAKGAINSTVGSASFDEDQVRGPKINVKNEGDNDWRGEIRGQTIDVSYHDGHASGVNLTMQVDQKPNDIVITGQLNGRIFRFEVNPERLMVRTDTRSDDIPRLSPTEFGSVNFHGDAIKADPPEPQFAFALMGVFM